MDKKKILKISAICVTIYTVFAILVILIFNSIYNNPIDNIAKIYIRDNTNIEEQYGKIVSIGKNMLHKTKKTESLIKSPYTVHTKDERVVVYITLMPKT